MRTLKMYGSNDNASYNVYINNVLSQSYNSDLIYKFDTETSLHDSYKIKISVTSGSLILKKCLVDYPARINNKDTKITFEQPIKNPLYVWTGKDLIVQPFDIKITAGSTIEFEQLMFNGPTYFVVKLLKEVDYTESLYVGNLVTKSFIPEVLNITPIYEYTKQYNDIWDKNQLKMLEKQVTKRLLQT